jgi:hypothetical protein
MARKTNYNFEKRQREIQKAEKKAAKAEAKKAASEERNAEDSSQLPGSDDSALETPPTDG